jgi:uncharacterized protein (TIGR02145 family)
MKLHFDLSIYCLVILSFAGCSKKDDSPVASGTTIAAVTTDTITAITTNSATGGGFVASDGGASVTSRGTCWSLASLPVNTGLHTVDGTGTGSFVSRMTNLLPDTLYYARAFAINSNGTAYGSTRTFRTARAPVYGVTDIDGNIYHMVRIGTLWWLQENLRTSRYRNGDPIPVVPADGQWKTLTTGAYCLYDNQGFNDTIYGKLYNWYAMNDSRGLCPAGWHVPSDNEWTETGNFLGGSGSAGGKMKSTGTLEAGSGLWYAPNKNATNTSGFSGLPGGYRINYGTFYSTGNVACFWSASDTVLNGWNYILDANNGELYRTFNLKTNGFSVRCCRD